MKNSLLIKTICLVLVWSLTTQSTLGAFAEANLWKERHQNILSSKEKEAPVLASLPAGLQAEPLFPFIKSALINTPKWSSSSKNQFLTLSPHLKNLIDSIPLAYGSIQDVFDSGKNNPAVVLMQDIHLNSEAQINIAALLQAMIDEKKIGVLGVEGAFEPFNFKSLRSFPDKNISRNVTRDFLELNRLAAPSYVGITSAIEPPPFLGVDNESHYRANVSAYLSTRRSKTKILKAVEGLQKKLAVEKAEIFSPQLKQLDDLQTAFHNSEINFGRYVKKLDEYANAVIPAHLRQGFGGQAGLPSVALAKDGIQVSNNSSGSPTKTFGDDDFVIVIAQFVEAYSMETSLDFGRVESERRQVVESLAKKLKPEELSQLLNMSLAYRMGKIGFGFYYQNLKFLCERKGISLEKTPAFANYVRYVLLSDGIKTERLLAAVQTLEKNLLQVFAKSPRELQLAQIGGELGLTEKLLNFSLTPQEWVEFKEMESLIPSVDGLKPFEQFYEEAEIRSQKMVENLLSSSYPGDKLLIAGGYHTPEMAQRLKNQKVSYVIVSPKITKIDDASGSAYLSIFSREKTPLEKLFVGEKLFVLPEGLHATPKEPVTTELHASWEARLGKNANRNPVTVKTIIGEPTEIVVHKFPHSADTYSFSLLTRIKLARHIPIQWTSALWSRLGLIWDESSNSIFSNVQSAGRFFTLVLLSHWKEWTISGVKEMFRVWQVKFNDIHPIFKDRSLLAENQIIILSSTIFSFVLFIPYFLIFHHNYLFTAMLYAAIIAQFIVNPTIHNFVNAVRLIRKEATSSLESEQPEFDTETLNQGTRLYQLARDAAKAQSHLSEVVFGMGSEPDRRAASEIIAEAANQKEQASLEFAAFLDQMKKEDSLNIVLDYFRPLLIPSRMQRIPSGDAPQPEIAYYPDYYLTILKKKEEMRGRRKGSFDLQIVWGDFLDDFTPFLGDSQSFEVKKGKDKLPYDTTLREIKTRAKILNVDPYAVFIVPPKEERSPREHKFADVLDMGPFSSDISETEPRAPPKPATHPSVRLDGLDSTIILGAVSNTLKDWLRNRGGLDNHNNKERPVVVLPPLLFNGKRSYGEVEFLIYYNAYVLGNLFKPDGEPLTIVGTEKQLKALGELARHTINGPNWDKGEYPWVSPSERKFFQALQRHFDPKSMPLEKFIKMVPFQNGFAAFRVRNEMVSVRKISNQSGQVTSFQIKRGGQADFVAELPVRYDHPQGPLYHVPEDAIQMLEKGRYGFARTFIGTSTGFDKDGDTTSLILWLEGVGIWVDPSAEGLRYLPKFGLTEQDVPYILLTHIHQDHDGGVLERILMGQRVNLIASRIVYEEFLQKASLMLQFLGSDLDPKKFINWLPMDPDKPLEMTLPSGRQAVFRSWWNIHTIPTNGFSIAYDDFSYAHSGDTQWSLSFIDQLVKEKKLTPEQGAVQKFRFFNLGKPKYDLIDHEAGGPPIHTKAEDLGAAVGPEYRHAVKLYHIPDSQISPLQSLSKARMFETQVILPSSYKRREHHALNVLGRNVLLKSVPPEKLRDRFFAVAREESVPAGQALIIQGRRIRGSAQNGVKTVVGEATENPVDEGRVYFILSGDADVLVDGKKVTNLGPGSHFGDWSVITGDARQATVVSVHPMQVYSLTADQYRELFPISPLPGEIRDLKQKLLLLEEWSTSAAQRHLQNLADESAMMLAKEAEWKDYQKDQLIIKEGEPGHDVFIIDRGEVTIHKKPHGPPVARMKRGQMFGEIAVLRNTDRKATVRADTDVRVLRLSENNFLELLNQFPALRIGLSQQVDGEIGPRNSDGSPAAILFHLLILTLRKMSGQEAAIKFANSVPGKFIGGFLAAVEVVALVSFGNHFQHGLIAPLFFVGFFFIDFLLAMLVYGPRGSPNRHAILVALYVLLPLDLLSLAGLIHLVSDVFLIFHLQFPWRLEMELNPGADGTASQKLSWRWTGFQIEMKKDSQAGDGSKDKSIVSPLEPVPEASESILELTRLLGNGTRNQKPESGTVSLQTLMDRQFPNRPNRVGVDLGTGDGWFLGKGQHKQLEDLWKRIGLSIEGTDDENSLYPTNQDFIEARKNKPMDWVSINAAYPRDVDRMLTDADRLLGESGLLYFAADTSNMEGAVEWLLAHGYYVSWMDSFEEYRGLSRQPFSRYEGGAHAGFILASRSPDGGMAYLKSQGNFVAHSRDLYDRVFFGMIFVMGRYGVKNILEVARELRLQPESLRSILDRLTQDGKIERKESSGKIVYHWNERTITDIGLGENGRRNLHMGIVGTAVSLCLFLAGCSLRGDGTPSASWPLVIGIVIAAGILASLPWIAKKIISSLTRRKAIDHRYLMSDPAYTGILSAEQIRIGTIGPITIVGHYHPDHNEILPLLDGLLRAGPEVSDEDYRRFVDSVIEQHKVFVMTQVRILALLERIFAEKGVKRIALFEEVEPIMGKMAHFILAHVIRRFEKIFKARGISDEKMTKALAVAFSGNSFLLRTAKSLSRLAGRIDIKAGEDSELTVRYYELFSKLETAVNLMGQEFGAKTVEAWLNLFYKKRDALSPFTNPEAAEFVRQYVAQSLTEHRIALLSSAFTTANAMITNILQRNSSWVKLIKTEHLRHPQRRIVATMGLKHFDPIFKTLQTTLRGSAQSHIPSDALLTGTDSRRDGQALGSNISPTADRPASIGQIPDDLARKLIDAGIHAIGFFGKAGVGKGTQCLALAQQLNNIFQRIDPSKRVESLSTGDYFRAINRILLNRKNPDKNKLKPGDEKYAALADLVPTNELVERMYVGKNMTDGTTIKILNAILSEERYRTAWLIFFDGFPRTPDQFQTIQRGEIKIDKRPVRLDLNIVMDGNDDVLVQRVIDRAKKDLAQGITRPDAPIDPATGLVNEPETKARFATRAEAYRVGTEPVVNIVKREPNALVVSGTDGNEIEVQQDLINKLDVFLSARATRGKTGSDALSRLRQLGSNASMFFFVGFLMISAVLSSWGQLSNPAAPTQGPPGISATEALIEPWKMTSEADNPLIDRFVRVALDAKTNALSLATISSERKKELAAAFDIVINEKRFVPVGVQGDLDIAVAFAETNFISISKARLLASRMTDDELRPILAHEIAHLVPRQVALREAAYQVELTFPSSPYSFFVPLDAADTHGVSKSEATSNQTKLKRFLALLVHDEIESYQVELAERQKKAKEKGLSLADYYAELAKNTSDERLVGTYSTFSSLVSNSIPELQDLPLEGRIAILLVLPVRLDSLKRTILFGIANEEKIDYTDNRAYGKWLWSWLNDPAYYDFSLSKPVAPNKPGAVLEKSNHAQQEAWYSDAYRDARREMRTFELTGGIKAPYAIEGGDLTHAYHGLSLWMDWKRPSSKPSSLKGIQNLILIGFLSLFTALSSFAQTNESSVDSAAVKSSEGKLPKIQWVESSRYGQRTFVPLPQSVKEATDSTEFVQDLLKFLDEAVPEVRANGTEEELNAFLTFQNWTKTEIFLYRGDDLERKAMAATEVSFERYNEKQNRLVVRLFVNPKILGAAIKNQTNPIYRTLAIGTAIKEGEQIMDAHASPARYQNFIDLANLTRGYSWNVDDPFEREGFKFLTTHLVWGEAVGYIPYLHYLRSQNITSSKLWDLRNEPNPYLRPLASSSYIFLDSTEKIADQELAALWGVFQGILTQKIDPTMANTLGRITILEKTSKQTPDGKTFVDWDHIKYMQDSKYLEADRTRAWIRDFQTRPGTSSTEQQEIVSSQPRSKRTFPFFNSENLVLIIPSGVVLVTALGALGRWALKRGARTNISVSPTLTRQQRRAQQRKNRGNIPLIFLAGYLSMASALASWGQTASIFPVALPTLPANGAATSEPWKIHAESDKPVIDRLVRVSGLAKKTVESLSTLPDDKKTELISLFDLVIQEKRFVLVDSQAAGDRMLWTEEGYIAVNKKFITSEPSDDEICFFISHEVVHLTRKQMAKLKVLRVADLPLSPQIYFSGENARTYQNNIKRVFASLVRSELEAYQVQFAVVEKKHPETSVGDYYASLAKSTKVSDLRTVYTKYSLILKDQYPGTQGFPLDQRLSIDLIVPFETANFPPALMIFGQMMVNEGVNLQDKYATSRWLWSWLNSPMNDLPSTNSAPSIKPGAELNPSNKTQVGIKVLSIAGFLAFCLASQIWGHDFHTSHLLAAGIFSFAWPWVKRKEGMYAVLYGIDDQPAPYRLEQFSNRLLEAMKAKNHVLAAATYKRLEFIESEDLNAEQNQRRLDLMRHFRNWTTPSIDQMVTTMKSERRGQIRDIVIMVAGLGLMALSVIAHDLKTSFLLALPSALIGVYAYAIGRRQEWTNSEAARALQRISDAKMRRDFESIVKEQSEADSRYQRQKRIKREAVKPAVKTAAARESAYERFVMAFADLATNQSSLAKQRTGGASFEEWWKKLQALEDQAIATGSETELTTALSRLENEIENQGKTIARMHRSLSAFEASLPYFSFGTARRLVRDFKGELEKFERQEDRSETKLLNETKLAMRIRERTRLAAKDEEIKKIHDHQIRFQQFLIEKVTPAFEIASDIYHRLDQLATAFKDAGYRPRTAVARLKKQAPVLKEIVEALNRDKSYIDTHMSGTYLFRLHVPQFSSLNYKMDRESARSLRADVGATLGELHDLKAKLEDIFAADEARLNLKVSESLASATPSATSLTQPAAEKNQAVQTEPKFSTDNTADPARKKGNRTGSKRDTVSPAAMGHHLLRIFNPKFAASGLGKALGVILLGVELAGLNVFSRHSNYALGWAILIAAFFFVDFILAVLAQHNRGDPKRHGLLIFAYVGLPLLFAHSPLGPEFGLLLAGLIHAVSDVFLIFNLQFPWRFKMELIPNGDGTASQQEFWKWIGFRTEMSKSGKRHSSSNTPSRREGNKKGGQQSDAVSKSPTRSKSSRRKFIWRTILGAGAIASGIAVLVAKKELSRPATLVTPASSWADFTRPAASPESRQAIFRAIVQYRPVKDLEELKGIFPLIAQWFWAAGHKEAQSVEDFLRRPMHNIKNAEGAIVKPLDPETKKIESVGVDAIFFGDLLKIIHQTQSEDFFVEYFASVFYPETKGASFGENSWLSLMANLDPKIQKWYELCQKEFKINTVSETLQEMSDEVMASMVLPEFYETTEQNKFIDWAKSLHFYTEEKSMAALELLKHPWYRENCSINHRRYLLNPHPIDLLARELEIQTRNSHRAFVLEMNSDYLEKNSNQKHTGQHTLNSIVYKDYFILQAALHKESKKAKGFPRELRLKYEADQPLTPEEKIEADAAFHRLSEKIYPYVKKFLNQIGSPYPIVGMSVFGVGMNRENSSSGTGDDKTFIDRKSLGWSVPEASRPLNSTTRMIENVLDSQTSNLNVGDVIRSPFRSAGQSRKGYESKYEVLELSQPVGVEALMNEALDWLSAEKQTDRKLIIYIAPLLGISSDEETIALQVRNVLNKRAATWAPSARSITFVFHSQKRSRSYSLASVLETAFDGRSSSYLGLKKLDWHPTVGQMAWIKTTERWDPLPKEGCRFLGMIIPLQSIVSYVIDVLAGTVKMESLQDKARNSEIAKEAA